jgi:hypothetical protein
LVGEDEVLVEFWTTGIVPAKEDNVNPSPSVAVKKKLKILRMFCMAILLK